MSHLIQMRMMPPKSPNNEQVVSFSAHDSDSDSAEEVDSAFETIKMIRHTRLGRIRTLTVRRLISCRQECQECEVAGANRYKLATWKFYYCLIDSVIFRTSL